MMLVSHGAMIKSGTLASLTGDISLTGSFSALLFVAHSRALWGQTHMPVGDLKVASAFCYK